MQLDGFRDGKWTKEFFCGTTIVRASLWISVSLSGTVLFKEDYLRNETHVMDSVPRDWWGIKGKQEALLGSSIQTMSSSFTEAVAKIIMISERVQTGLFLSWTI